jgi:hypothetical protein
MSSSTPVQSTPVASSHCAPPILRSLRRDLEDKGYCHIALPLSQSQFTEAAKSLGNIVCGTDVQIVSNASSYICRPELVPFHTDHPMVDFIGWRCEEQDPWDGSNLLIDLTKLLKMHSPEKIQLLADAELQYPPLVEGNAGGFWPLIRIVDGRLRVYYAPWLSFATSSHASRIRTWIESMIQEQVSSREGSIGIRLEKGECLFVDNSRILHGRARLSVNSPRCLNRLWVTATANHT